MAHFRTVCRTDEVPEGEARMFVVGEVLVGVFHVKGEFFALDSPCPHEGASLAHGIIEGDTVLCRIHHWRFSIRDGTYFDEDKSEYNARTFPVRVVGDEVQLKICERTSGNDQRRNTSGT